MQADTNPMLRLVLDSLFVFVGILDLEGTLIEANKATFDADSIDRNAVYGRKLWDCYWWSYSPAVQSELQAAIERAARGEVSRYDAHVRTANGNLSAIDFMIAPLYNEQGKIVYITTSAIDIDERRRSEDALRTTRSQLQSIIDNAPAAIYVKDHEGRYILTNRDADANLGLTQEKILGKTDYDLFGAEFADGYRSVELDVLNHGGVRQTEDTVPQEDGFHTYISLKFPLKDDHGRNYAVCGISTDITGRKRAEEALRQSEERMRLAALASGTGMWHWNLMTNDLQWDTQCKAIFGLRADAEMSMEIFLALIYPADRDGVLKEIAQAIGEHRDYDIDYRVTLPDGETRWVSARGRAFYSEDNTPIRMEGVALDITARRRTEVLDSIQKRALQSIVAGLPVTEVLESLVNMVEAHDDSLHCAMLQVDSRDCLSCLVAPSLPPGFADAIRKQPLAEITAAVRNDLVIAADMERSTAGSPAQDFALRHGLRACWTAPIVRAGQTLTGLVALYCRRAQSPGPFHLDLLRLVTDLTGVALERRDAELERESRQAEAEALNVRLRRAMTETHHRVRNSLQMLLAIIDLYSANSVSAGRDVFRKLSMQVKSLAEIHDMLTLRAKMVGEAEYISTRETLNRLLPLLHHLAPDRHMRFHIAESRLPIDTGLSLALVTNELVTNALRYCRTTVAVTYTVENGTGMLTVTDDGPGFPDDFALRKSCFSGLELVESLVAWDLGGVVTYSPVGEAGGRVRVTITTSTQRGE